MSQEAFWMRDETPSTNSNKAFFFFFRVLCFTSITKLFFTFLLCGFISVLVPLKSVKTLNVRLDNQLDFKWLYSQKTSVFVTMLAILAEFNYRIRFIWRQLSLTVDPLFLRDYRAALPGFVCEALTSLKGICTQHQQKRLIPTSTANDGKELRAEQQYQGNPIERNLWRLNCILQLQRESSSGRIWLFTALLERSSRGHSQFLRLGCLRPR